MSRIGESMETGSGLIRGCQWLGRRRRDWVEGSGREGTGTLFLGVMVVEMFCNWIVVTVAQLSGILEPLNCTLYYGQFLCEILS